IDFNEDSSTNLVLTVGDGTGTAVTNLAFSASSSNPTLLPSGNVSFGSISPGGSAVNGTLTATLTTAANQFGTNNLTITALRRTDNATASVVIPMNVRSVNDAPTISRLNVRVTGEDQPVSFEFIVSDVDTAVTNLSILATSDNQNVISNTNLLFFGVTNYYPMLPANNVKFTLVPNLHAVGSNVTISVRVTDTNGVTPAFTVTSNFQFFVTQVNNPPTISSIPSPQTTFAGQATTNIAFTVDDPEALPTGSETLTVTATSSDQTVVKIGNIVVSPVAGPRGSRTVKIPPEQSGPSKTNATSTIPL